MLVKMFEIIRKGKMLNVFVVIFSLKPYQEIH